MKKEDIVANQEMRVITMEADLKKEMHRSASVLRTLRIVELDRTLRIVYAYCILSPS